MIFSLIITSNDRIYDLRRLFSSILAQDYKYSIQVIFINQGNYNPTEEFTLSDKLDYIQVDAGRLIPLSQARNLGISLATGNIIAFPDDDCWYASDLLTQLANFFDLNPTISCLCTSVFDPDRGLSYGKRPLNIKVPITYANLFKLPISVGIFLRNSALDKAGRYFDERLGAGTALGSGEETELIARVLASGSKVVYNGYIRVFHPVTDYTEKDARKFYTYGLGFGYLNGLLCRRGHWSVVVFYLSVLIRSLAGILLRFTRPLERNLYTYRLIGVLNGFLKGLRQK